jgi:hypothetical protein
MGGEHAMEHYDVCIGPNLTCMNDLLNRMGQFDHVEYNGEKARREPMNRVYKSQFFVGITDRQDFDSQIASSKN